MATKKPKPSQRSKKRPAVKDLPAKAAARVKGGGLDGTGKTVKIQFFN